MDVGHIRLLDLARRRLGSRLGLLRLLHALGVGLLELAGGNRLLSCGGAGFGSLGLALLDHV